MGHSQNLPLPITMGLNKLLHIKQGFPCGSAGKESAYKAGDLGLILGSGRSPGEGIGYLLQYSGLENSMDSMVHGVTKSQKPMSDFHFHYISSKYITNRVKCLNVIRKINI